SLYVDRSMSANDSELNVESLIENLKNMIIKKLLILCMIRSSMSLSVSSITASQSSTSVSVSDSLTSAISVSVTLTLTTSTSSDFTVSTFITSSPHFKKILYRLNKSCLSFLVAPASEIILIRDDNTAETTFSHLQAFFITFSFSSAGKVVCTLSYK
ncbi:hypothetical protein BDDG_13240, partial [Blastomyces dermatitidis ATCC 18188]